ncbi:MAG: MBL fold metallo-hydrolase [Planctomycetaceae bacterium]
MNSHRLAMLALALCVPSAPVGNVCAEEIQLLGDPVDPGEVSADYPYPPSVARLVSRGPEAGQKFWDPSQYEVLPFRIFDNVYYVGGTLFSSYIVTTSEGLILIDANMGGPLTKPFLQRIADLGFHLDEIKYVLITHAHVDHVGAAAELQRHGAKVVMGLIDWDYAQTQYDLPGFRFEMPRRDVAARDGDRITLGDTTIDCLASPGHTPGATSYIVPVRDGEHEYRAIVLAGQGTNFSGLDQAEAFVDTMERLVTMAWSDWRDGNPLSVNLSAHPEFGQIIDRARLLQHRQPGQPHPYVDPYGTIVFLEKVLNTNARPKLETERESNR